MNKARKPTKTIGKEKKPAKKPAAKTKQRNPEQLRKALVAGDFNAARALVDELSRDQISQALYKGYEHGEQQALEFLGVNVSMTQITSPQFILCGKPRVVSLQEVAEKCGPVYGPTYTMTVGPRPAGWGAAAVENRILSWTDDGFGLVGDQLVNIADRYLVARPLDEFEGALIVGSLDKLKLRKLPLEKQMVLWKGRPLTTDPFDPLLFREIFSAAMKFEWELNWTCDVRSFAAAREALEFFLNFLNYEAWDEFADIALAYASIKLSIVTQSLVNGDTAIEERQKHIELCLDRIEQVPNLDPSLKRWTDWIKAIYRQPVPDAAILKQLTSLADADPLGPALLTAYSTLADLNEAKKANLDPLESFVGAHNSPTSPYLSFILKIITVACTQLALKNTKKMNNGGDSAAYMQAIRLGQRGPLTIQWLTDAIEARKNDYVRLCLNSGFKPAGRFMRCPTGTNYYNPLALAAYCQNIEAVHAFLESRADPDEPSQFGGLGTLVLGELLAAHGSPWPEEIMQALRAARNRTRVCKRSGN